MNITSVSIPKRGFKHACLVNG
uniref:Uncharacterized protein n=1 Tax=Anguilla anguilla TaxID=7936 RepID=A0A0E9SK44_ANGAN